MSQMRKPSDIAEQIKSYLHNARCFIHYPYPVERPYDTNYQLTWTHSHRSVLLLEWDETVLFALCEPEFDTDRGLLYAESALISMAPQFLHLFVPAEFQLERILTGNDTAHDRWLFSASFEACAFLRDWFNHSLSHLYVIELYDALLDKCYKYRTESPLCVHCGADYAAVVSSTHLCVWRGEQTNFTVHSDTLEISDFAHGIVAEVLESRFAVLTAATGSRLRWETKGG